MAYVEKVVDPLQKAVDQIEHVAFALNDPATEISGALLRDYADRLDEATDLICEGAGEVFGAFVVHRAKGIEHLIERAKAAEHLHAWAARVHSGILSRCVPAAENSSPTSVSF